MGSIWLINETEMVYLRMPKQEGPRESPPGRDWGGPDAGKLQDLVWHPFDSWEITPGAWIGEHADGTLIELPRSPRLRIETPDGRISAPEARVT